MKIGDIVRRTLIDGTPVGNYIIVVSKKGNTIRGRYIYSELEFTLKRDGKYKIVNKCSLRVSDKDFDSIEKNHAFVHYHDITKRWENAADTQPDIVVIHNGMGEKVYFSGCEFARVRVKFVPKIKVYFGHRLWTEKYI